MVATEADTLKTSRGAFPPNASRMKCSGIRRPEVDPLEPNVNVLSAMAFGNSSENDSPVLVLAMK